MTQRYSDQECFRIAYAALTGETWAPPYIGGTRAELRKTIKRKRVKQQK